MRTRQLIIHNIPTIYPIQCGTYHHAYSNQTSLTLLITEA